MITTKSKLEIVLDPEAVQQWDYLHSNLEANIGQLLLETGEGLLAGTPPAFTHEKVNGYYLELDGFRLGLVKFTPAGIEVPDETSEK